MTAKVLGAFFTIVMLIGCENNPFTTSPDELLQHMHMTPNKVTLQFGSEQLFKLHLYKGSYDDVRVSYISGPDTKYYDGECACDSWIPKLGRLEKLSKDTFLYIAPTSVREGVSLPVRVEIYASTGKKGNWKNKTLATITIVR